MSTLSITFAAVKVYRCVSAQKFPVRFYYKYMFGMAGKGGLPRVFVRCSAQFVKRNLSLRVIIRYTDLWEKEVLARQAFCGSTLYRSSNFSRIMFRTKLWHNYVASGVLICGNQVSLNFC
jgi:hypothetical protein